MKVRMLGPHGDRLRAHAERWGVVLDERTIKTANALIAFGRRAADPVALKIVKGEGDEWRSGEIVRAFGGRGMLRALEFDDGAILLERLMPGESLVDVVLRGDDDEATSIVARIIAELSPDSPPSGVPTLAEWGRSFERYQSSGDDQIPRSVVDEAAAHFAELCNTQKDRRLLHGDLQHTNILFDDRRGWLAIDPKGVIGEREFEVCAFLRNPIQAPRFFTDLTAVERRLRLACDKARLSYERALRWVFAGAILSAIWGVEDDGFVRGDNPSLILARTVRPAIRN